MDRQIVYPGQIPLETDLLNTNRNAMIALGKLAGAIFGTGGIVNGLAVAPTSPASLSINVGIGEIYQLANVDDTAYSSLAADTTDTVVKQGILLQPATLSCPAPSTSGFSINYLIEAKFQDSDTGSVVLPYYNASNPQQAYSGPNNTGASQATKRAGTVSLQVKAGIAASTGTQTTPAVDSGWIALAVVTVANGQSTIVAGNIVAATNGQILSSSLSTGRLLNIQIFTSSGTYTPTPGTNSVEIEIVGGGGGSGGTPACSSSQVAASAGGGSGAYARGRFTSGFSGALVTIGSGGSAGAAGSTTATTGGTTSFGSLMSAAGGTISSTGAATAITPPAVLNAQGGNTANPTGGNIVSIAGVAGGNAFGFSTNGVSSGAGGSNPLGSGGWARSGLAAGVPGTGYGAGAGGALTPASGTAQAGAAGSPGVCIIREYA